MDHKGMDILSMSEIVSGCLITKLAVPSILYSLALESSA